MKFRDDSTTFYTLIWHSKSLIFAFDVVHHATLRFNITDVIIMLGIQPDTNSFIKKIIIFFENYISRYYFFSSNDTEIDID